MRCAYVLFGVAIGSALLADTKIALTELPAAVQAAAKAQAGGARIVAASKETENGQTTYEVETRTNGKSRDLSFTGTGKLLAVEQEIALDSLPAPAKEYIQKKAAGGAIRKVESVTEGSVVSYEATIAAKGQRNREIAVNPDGTPHLD